jgi:hypothetical protein
MILLPSNPTLNQIWIDPATGNRWQWDGFGWNNLGRELKASGIPNDSDLKGTTVKDALDNTKGYFASLTDCACPITIDSLTFVVDSPTQATITAVASGGLGALTYSLYDGATLIEENLTGIFIVSDAKTYTVKVNDEVGSTEASDTIAVAFLDADLVTYLAALTISLSSAQQIRLDVLIKAIKTTLSITNLSEYFDIFYLMANETAESALKNIVKRANDATPVNSPTFTQWLGYSGTGTQYINSNYKLLSDSANYLQNSAVVGFGQMNSTSAATVNIYGVIDGSNYGVSLANRLANDRLSFRVNSEATDLTALGSSTETQAHWVTTRESANLLKIYKNNILFDTSTKVSRVIPDLSLFILARNNNGSGDTISAARCGYLYTSKFVDETKTKAVTTIIETYLDEIENGLIP